MRHVLKTLKERGKWSQTTTGKQLGIGQQAAGHILNKGGGFSRPTALRLAELCGFDSPESMLADLGALAKRQDAPEGWFERDLAAGSARRLGYEEAAIDRVIARFGAPQYAQQPARWWMDRIVHEAAGMAAEREIAPPPPSASTMPASKRMKPKKKGAA